LEFYHYQDDPVPPASADIANGYASLFTHPALRDLKTLKLEVSGESNFESIFEAISSKASEVPMFLTVETIKVYKIQRIR
jgi:hypothetical protein